jgi:hypothetical protein
MLHPQSTPIQPHGYECNPHEPIHSILCWSPPRWTEKQPTFYNVINPTPMDGHYLPPRLNKLLWEMSEWICNIWSQYYKRPQILLMCSLLMNSSTKSMHQIPMHLPILLHLSTYLCLPNLHSRSWLSYMLLPYLFGNSNHKMLSICYPGSIKKIKHLGPLYWLTSLSPSPHPWQVWRQQVASASRG